MRFDKFCSGRSQAMKCPTAKNTIAIVAAALLTAPVASWAQEKTAAPRPSMSQPAGAPGDNAQHGAAQEHLRQAKTALNEIPAASLTGTAKTRVSELKRHLSMLEQSGSGAATTAARGKANWSTEVAAADRILTELMGDANGATAPAATGTTGAAKSAKPAGAAITLDDNARAKLQDVRTHLTAFAASMSG